MKRTVPLKPRSQESHRELSAASRRTRVLVVDDHVPLRRIVVYFLQLQPDLEVVGQADNGREAISLCSQLGPDVVVMDVAMPEMDGITATRLIKNRAAGSGVAVIGFSQEVSNRSSMLKAGARCFISKDESWDQLLNAIRDSSS